MIELVESDKEGGTIVWQSLEAGTEVDEGSAIQFRVSAGPARPQLRQAAEVASALLEEYPRRARAREHNGIVPVADIRNPAANPVTGPKLYHRPRDRAPSHILKPADRMRHNGIGARKQDPLRGKRRSRVSNDEQAGLIGAR